MRDEDLVASAEGLAHDAVTPMSRIVLQDGTARRENVWPGQNDLGTPVILPGGEAGILQKWWHAEDRSEWRWQVEFYNHT